LIAPESVRESVARLPQLGQFSAPFRDNLIFIRCGGWLIFLGHGVIAVEK
jgi:hypothetical protein